MFFSQVRHHYWENAYLFKHYPDQAVRRCVPKSEIHNTLTFCHSYACGGHFGGRRTAGKVLKVGSFGQLCTMMLTDLILLMSVVNVQVPCPVMI